MNFKISFFSPFGIFIGLVIQTFYGWSTPKTTIEALLMGIHIFIFPTLFATIAFFAFTFFILSIAALTGMNVNIQRKPSPKFWRSSYFKS